jgi:hypothetical protein
LEWKVFRVVSARRLMFGDSRKLPITC